MRNAPSKPMLIVQAIVLVIAVGFVVRLAWNASSRTPDSEPARALSPTFTPAGRQSVAPVVVAQEATPPEETYVTDVVRLYGQTGDALRAIGELLDSPDFGSQDSIFRLVANTSALEANYDALICREPPQNYISFHVEHTSAYLYCIAATRTLMYGIDHSDAEAISVAGKLVEVCDAKFRESEGTLLASQQ